jgi:hypothetical protein
LFAGFPNADHAALRRRLARFDPLALASAIAALQVLPDNAKGNWRLGFLAGMVAGLSPEGEFEELTAGDLDALVNKGSLAGAAGIVEDPPEGPFTEEIAFHGGSYLVGEGLGESDAYAVRRLAGACFRPGALPAPLQTELRDCWVAALKVLDAALRGAGLRRNLEPVERSGIAIPDLKRLIELQKEMTFGPQRLGPMVPPRFIAALEPLIAEIGAAEWDDEELMDGAADRSPFLRRNEWIVLARPMAVLSALRHHLSLRVAEECGPERLAVLFGAAVDRDVLASLRRMAMAPEAKAERDASAGFTEIEARFDEDKILHALVLTDDFEGLNPAEPYTAWDGSACVGAIGQRLGEIEAEAKEAGEAPLLLLVMQPAGRQALLLAPGGEQEVPLILLTAADLETIAVIEAEDPLALWKFADALSRLGADTALRMSSMLDVYGAYHDGGRSFGSAAEMSYVSFMPGYAGPERIEATRARDRHGVAAPGGLLREVERRTTQAELDVHDRIYYESGFSGPRLSIFVAGAPLALWVSGPEGDIARSFDAVESVAYWIGELCQPWADFFGRLSSQLPALEVQVDFESPEYWFGAGEDPGSGSFGGFEVIDYERVMLRLGPALRRTLPQADNSAERELVGLLIEALIALGEGVEVETPGSEERAAVREAVAPLGLKKHLILMPAELNRAIAEPQDPPRTVQEADRSAVRYSLGRALGEKFGIRDAEVPQGQRKEILNEAVDILFKEITATLDGCRGEGLLELLMEMNERLIATGEHRRAILPARLATYPQAALRLREDSAEASLAAICARFLVEYVAAAAPSGETAISLATYDAVLAAAAELVDWADLSDAIHSGLSQLGLRFDRDGILRSAGEDRYGSGRSHFFDRHIAGERRKAESRWAGRFEREETDERPEWLGRLDALFVAEAGVPLHLLGETLIAANHVAMTGGQDVVVLSRPQAVAALAGAIDREAEEIEKALDYLALGPRAKFLKPPAGKEADVYPWRYARRWSYNRRPFVRRIYPDGEEEILWGQRQVFTAFNILYGQIESGRYQELASAPELKSELGRLADQEGAEFEERVAAEAEQLGFAVARSVKRLAGEKLRRSASEDLGDIDVLAADPAAKTIWAIECKSLSGSLSSSEVVLEMTAHFNQEGTSSVTKHGERVAWVGKRMPAALERLGLPANVDGWDLRGLIVTGRDVIAPFIDDLPFTSVPFEELAGFLADPPAPATPGAE